MNKPIKLALLTALPIELVNFFFLFPQIKGYAAVHQPTALEHFRDVEWGVLHYPGLLLAVPLLHAPGIGLALAFAITFLIGYVETTLLFIAFFYLVGFVYPPFRNRVGDEHKQY